MKNSQAIAALISAAEAADDPLDELACRRAAVWLRWCDGFGATLTRPETDRIATPGALGEAARGLIRRLAEEYPAPVEDIRLEFLNGDEGTSWALSSIAASAAHRKRNDRSGSTALPV